MSASFTTEVRLHLDALRQAGDEVNTDSSPPCTTNAEGVALQWGPKRVSDPEGVALQWGPKRVSDPEGVALQWGPKRVSDPEGVALQWGPKRVSDAEGVALQWGPKQVSDKEGALALAGAPLLSQPPHRDKAALRDIEEEQMSHTEEVHEGVMRLVDDYVGAVDEDTVVIAYTPESRVSAAWIAAAVSGKTANVIALPMRPLVDATFAARLQAVLPKKDNLRGRLVIFTVERETMSHFEILRDTLAKFRPSQWVAARIIGASPEFFAYAMRDTKSRITSRNTALLEKFMPARAMRVQTRSGTNLKIQLDSSRYRWISNRGHAREGGFIVLPPGEIATYPADINGVFVADGAVNVNLFTGLDVRLRRNPVTVEIEAGRAKSFKCDDPDLADFIGACLSVPNGDRVGELGFGTNLGIPDFLPMNTHINERRAGLHLGFGQNNQSNDVVDYRVELHMDLISDGATIWVDDMESEPVNLGSPPESSSCHPNSVMDEDIDGDCCGLWAADPVL